MEVAQCAFDFNSCVNISEFIFALASAKDNFSTWPLMNKALLYKASKKDIPQTITKKDVFTEKLDLDKLFREKEKNSDHMNDNKVKPFFLKFVINHLRSHLDTITPLAVRRVIKKFCISESFQSSRFEAINFLNELLELNPPVHLNYRHFWMEVFMAKEIELCFKRTLKEFRNGCLQIIRDNKHSIAYREFLLNVLEYDYAAVQNRAEKPPFSRSGVKVTELQEMNMIPLAYFLVARPNSDFTIYKETDDFDIIDDALDPGDNSVVLHTPKLIALLIDTYISVCCYKFHSELPRLNSWDGVPEAVEELILHLKECLNKSGQRRRFTQLVTQHSPWISSALKARRDSTT